MPLMSRNVLRTGEKSHPSCFLKVHVEGDVTQAIGKDSATGWGLPRARAGAAFQKALQTDALLWCPGGQTRV